MLSRIPKRFQGEALSLLRWLAYSREPISLKELVETLRIDPNEDRVAEDDSFATTEELLHLLSGLVVTFRSSEDDTNSKAMDGTITNSVCVSSEGNEAGNTNSTSEDAGNHKFCKLDDDGNEKNDCVFPANSGILDDQAKRADLVDESTKIKLAHLSIKEYLQSNRILDCPSRNFHLQPGKEQNFLTQSCLSYLTAYAKHPDRKSNKADLDRFPLLRYTALNWHKHALLQGESDGCRESEFLGSMATIESFNSLQSFVDLWEIALWMDGTGLQPLEYGLFYATFLGLYYAAKKLIASGANVNAYKAAFGSVLQVACMCDNTSIVKLLLENGADINTRGGTNGSALQHACARGNLNIAKLLLENGANINAQGSHHGNALQAACEKGSTDIVKLLLENGANVNDQGGYYGNALQAACVKRSMDIVELLLKNGADINAQGGFFGNALQAACWYGRMSIVKLLLENGADVIAQGGRYVNALQAASTGKHEEIVQLLLENGA